MINFEIKTEERRFTLAGIDAVVEAVRAGRIGRAAQIRATGTKAWARIDATEGLAALFEEDLWDAWETETDASVLDDFQQLPPRQPRKLASAPTLIDGFEDLPAASVEAVDADQASPVEISKADKVITSADTTHPRGPRRPKAKIIDFPVAPHLEIQGDLAIALESHRAPEGGHPRPPLGRLPVRWGPIIVLASAATGVMMLWVWFVNINAGENFVQTRRTLSTTQAPTALQTASVAPSVSPYDTLEDATREQMMEGILDIPGETEFEDALLIELRRVRVDVRSVRIKIETWTGRKNDVPDEVSFNLKLMERDGELDRDLGAMGLVLGKYIQHYGLQVNTLNIIIGEPGGLRKLQMNPETARRYFTHRMSLERFLSTAFDAQ